MTDRARSVTTTIVAPDEEIVRAACPTCGKQRGVTPGEYVCGDCATRFVVHSVAADLEGSA